jgi:cytochrome P450
VPGRRRLRDALARLDAEVDAIRSASAHRDGGVVGRLTRDGDVPPKLVRDEAMSFFLAGHETSAAGLAWAVHLLADLPDLQADLADEARTVLDGGDVAGEAVERLVRAQAVVDETLRLRPPAPWFSRRLIERDRFGDVELPGRALVVASPWITQRDPRWWPEPDEFRIARFLPDAPKPAPLTYFPFAAGPRTCIGLAFARMEMTIVLALILRRLCLARVDGDAPRPRAEITLRPEPSVRLVVRPRA